MASYELESGSYGYPSVLRDGGTMSSHNPNVPWYAGGHNGGVTTYTLAQLRARMRRLLEDPTYLSNLQKALRDRTCPSQIEALCYHYAYGKPVEQVNVNLTSGQEDLSQLSTEELAKRAQAITEALREATALQEAIDVSATSSTSSTTPNTNGSTVTH